MDFRPAPHRRSTARDRVIILCFSAFVAGATIPWDRILPWN